MWWDAEQTIGSWVRWYKTPPGTPWLPFPHRFSSETWDQVHWYNGGAGEDDATNSIYDKGALPSPPPLALQPCGPADWWLNGCPSDAPPASGSCCTPAGLRGAYSRAYSMAWDRLRVTP